MSFERRRIKRAGQGLFLHLAHCNLLKQALFPLFAHAQSMKVFAHLQQATEALYGPKPKNVFPHVQRQTYYHHLFVFSMKTNLKKKIFTTATCHTCCILYFSGLTLYLLRLFKINCNSKKNIDFFFFFFFFLISICQKHQHSMMGSNATSPRMVTIIYFLFIGI